MTTFSKDTARQANVLDGTVYCYEPVPGEGVYATVAGRDGQVYIVALDMTDLSHLHRAAEAAHADENRSVASEDLTTITQAGMPFLMDRAGGGGVTSPFCRFSFYSDPRRLIKNPCGGVTVGLGEGDDGTELLYLNVGDGYRNDGDILLDADELTCLIDQLTILRNSMREKEES